MRKTVVIWGASGHARVVADIFRLGEEYEIVGFLDDTKPELRGHIFCGAPILGGREEISVLRNQGVSHITFGFGDCAARQRLASFVPAAGLEFATAIHPRAVIASDAQIGAGTVICAGAVVNPAARVGRNSIINTGASIDHDCLLGEAVHIGPGVRMGGWVTIGDGTWIGIGATILDRRKVGHGSIVGAGSLVTKDVQDAVVAYGSPSRLIRSVAPENEPWRQHGKE